MPLVSIITPGRALRALETSALPNPLVNNESVVQRVAVICSGESRGLKMEMAAESRATQFHMRLSVVAEEAEARAFTETLPRAPKHAHPKPSVQFIHAGKFVIGWT